MGAGVRKLKPSEYLDEFYPGSGYTTQTVRNWARKGKLRFEMTPTNRMLIIVNHGGKSSTVDKLVGMLES